MASALTTRTLPFMSSESKPKPVVLSRARNNAPRTRAREQRAGLAEVVSAVVAAMATDDGAGMRERFEQAVCRVTRCRSARVQPGQALATGPTPLVREGGTIDVPVRPGPAVLRVTPSAMRRLDDWDRQLLDAAADLAGLVLEIERTRIRGGKGKVPRAVAPGLVGSSPEMQDLRDRIVRVAKSEAAVLIEGESGSGKELVARQIHQGSRRARSPFVAVNCAALVETLLEAELFGIEDRTATGVRGRRGKFELADGGTLFLDEIGDLSLTAQAKLLRVLQDMVIERVGGHVPLRVDVRVIAATNRNLAALVEAGQFRPDLFYRLNCVDIRVPPLRTRRGDIAELVELFVLRYGEGKVVGISPEAMEALLEYEWPGNVRELERVIQRAVALTDASRIGSRDLPLGLGTRYGEVFQPALERGESLRAFGSRYVRLVLRRCHNNKREACQQLGISYHTLQAYLKLAATSDRAGGAAPAGDPADPPASEERGQARLRTASIGNEVRGAESEDGHGGTVGRA